MRESYGSLADALGHDALAEALLDAAARRVSLVSALVATGVVDAARLATMLEGAKERDELPVLREVRPMMRFVEALPPDLCERLLALPVGHDATTGTIDVAVVDGADRHAAEEIAYWLKAPVRVLWAPLAAMSDALAEVAVRPRSHPAPARSVAHDEGSIDLAEGPPSSGVPTQRGPFPTALSERPAETKRGH